MAFKKGQVVKTSQGKTGIVKEEEFWLLEGKTYESFEEYSEAYEQGLRPQYFPYKVQLGSKVVDIGYKHLRSVNSVTLGVRVEDYIRVNEALTKLGIDHNFR